MTYGEMQARIADEMEDDDLQSGGQIAKAIQTAIKFYERKRLYFNPAVNVTFNTVAGQEYYGADDLAAIPNLITIDSMYVTMGGARSEILPAPFATMDAAQSGLYSGSPPRFRAYYAQQIRLYGIPSAVWPITMAGLFRLPTLVEDDDTNAWMEDGEELIRQAAERILMSDVTHELPRGSPPTAAEALALNALQKETRLRMGPQTLRNDAHTAMQNDNSGRMNIYSGGVR